MTLDSLSDLSKTSQMANIESVEQIRSTYENMFQAIGETATATQKQCKLMLDTDILRPGDRKEVAAAQTFCRKIGAIAKSAQQNATSAQRKTLITTAQDLNIQVLFLIPSAAIKKALTDIVTDSDTDPYIVQVGDRLTQNMVGTSNIGRTTAEHRNQCPDTSHAV